MEKSSILLIGLLLVTIILLMLHSRNKKIVSPKNVSVIRPSYWLGPGGTKEWYPIKHHHPHPHNLGPGGTYHPHQHNLGHGGT